MGLFFAIPARPCGYLGLCLRVPSAPGQHHAQCCANSCGNKRDHQRGFEYCLVKYVRSHGGNKAKGQGQEDRSDMPAAIQSAA
jgi:hypothetical protein